MIVVEELEDVEVPFQELLEEEGEILWEEEGEEEEGEVEEIGIQ